MGLLTLLRKGIKKQKGGIIGISVLLFVVSFSLVMAITVSVHAGGYVSQEMDRLGFGDVTAWVSHTDDLPGLTGEIESLDAVESAQVQPLVFAGYRINDAHSDNEGQLIAHDPAAYPYRFLNDTLDRYREAVTIEPGEIYISPAMQSAYNAEIGDTIHFTLSRNGDERVFVIKGYFEDPFMGSSMIDMKSFLISPSDFEEVLEAISRISDFNVLARSGAMLHLFQAPGSSLSPTAFSGEINTRTSLSNYSEFVYTDASIYGFMLILQNIFTGFLFAFSILLLAVCMIVMGHSISNTIEQESKDMGILKTMGYTGTQLRIVQLLQNGLGIAVGMLAALLCAAVFAGPVSRLTVTAAGLLMPSDIPVGLCLMSFAVIAAALALYILLKTRKIVRIPPVQAISGITAQHLPGVRAAMPVQKKGLAFFLALRQLSCGKRRYIGTCMVSVLLVFFVSVVGRMNTWLGPNGEGLMNAFSAADHDLGVQPMEAVDMDEIENRISSYTRIEDVYALAMQSVTVNGAAYTANVIDEPARFHMLSGSTCLADDEIVVTQFVAADLGLVIGDSVTVAYEGQSGTYRITGIYQCANETGGNIGMNRAGYAKLGSADAFIWCHHYILADSGMNKDIMAELQGAYRTELSVHTNSWSGLDGIVGTMRFLTFFMYAIAAGFIAIVMALTASKLLHAEQRDMAVLKSIGFSSRRLRLAFSMRFGVVVAAGSIVGAALSCMLADPAVTSLLQLFGIGEFRSGFTFVGSILPAIVITALFAVFAYLFSHRIKRISPAILISR